MRPSLLWKVCDIQSQRATFHGLPLPSTSHPTSQFVLWNLARALDRQLERPIIYVSGDRANGLRVEWVMQTRPEVSCFQNRPPLEVVLRSSPSVGGGSWGGGGVQMRGQRCRGGSHLSQTPVLPISKCGEHRPRLRKNSIPFLKISNCSFY